MPVTISRVPPDGQKVERIAVLCDGQWMLWPQIDALCKWLEQAGPTLAKGAYTANVGFCWRRNASADGPVLEPTAMRLMAEIGMTLSLTEYSGFADLNTAVVAGEVPHLRLTPKAKEAIAAAYFMAQGLSHSCVGSEHLVLGLYSVQNSVPSVVFTRNGYTLDSIRAAVQKSYVASAPDSTDSKPALVFGAVLAQASEQAKRLGHSFIGSEDLLLSLLGEESGGAARTFAALGIDSKAWTQGLLRELSPTQ